MEAEILDDTEIFAADHLLFDRHFVTISAKRGDDPIHNLYEVEEEADLHLPQDGRVIALAVLLEFNADTRQLTSHDAEEVLTAMQTYEDDFPGVEYETSESIGHVFHSVTLLPCMCELHDNGHDSSTTTKDASCGADETVDGAYTDETKQHSDTFYMRYGNEDDQEEKSCSRVTELIYENLFIIDATSC